MDPKSLKVNFQLQTFAYGAYIENDYSVKTRVLRLDLRLPWSSTQIDIETDALYYLNLATNYIPEANFSMGVWYSDNAIVRVEAGLIQLKTKNMPQQMQPMNNIRGRMSNLSIDRHLTKGIVPSTLNTPSGYTPGAREVSAYQVPFSFQLKPYLMTLELEFKDSWWKLGDEKKNKFLIGLDEYADKNMPEINTVLVDTPLSSTPHTLCIYANHYTDLQIFGAAIRSLPIAEHLIDPTKILICNHTKVQVIERPHEWVRRG